VNCPPMRVSSGYANATETGLGKADPGGSDAHPPSEMRSPATRAQ
jgi:hypothetical protein